MRIVSWNCKGAYARKSAQLENLKPDLAIVPECARLDGIQGDLTRRGPNSAEWVGRADGKGLAILGYGDYSVARAEFYNPDLEHILPVRVSGPISFLLIGVWTRPDDHRSYVRPLLRAIEEWKSVLSNQQVVIAGDFNMNYVFDKPSRKYKFRHVTDALESREIKSLYHEMRGERHGEETEKTFYLYHHKDKPHHIDYVFASEKLRAKLTALSIGSFDEWHSLSDHVPLVADFGADG